MSRFSHIALSLALAFVLSGLSGADAQTYEQVLSRNLWNGTSNVAGLRADSLSISLAQFHAQAEHGDFRNYSDAIKRWSIGADAHTIMHLEKFSMAGSFSFEHATGYDMCGSMLISPGYYPLDVIEFTPGRKDRQTYSFAGGFSTDLGKRWRVGAGIDFTSQNYAKRKDLRHTDYALDMTVSPGFIYMGGDWSIGASYIFNKTSETTTAEVVGSTVANYYAFLDKGLMYGAYELWSGSGVHLDESGISGFPLSEMAHGAAVQAGWKDLLLEVKYLHAKGKNGEKKTIWFEFPSDKVSVLAAYKLRKAGGEHFVRVNVDWMRQKNYENVLGTETSNGITITYVYGSNNVFERNVLRVAPEYEWVGKGGSFRGGTEIVSLVRQSSLMYPYIYRQNMTTGKVYAEGTVSVGSFDLGLGCSFSLGDLTEEEESADEDVSVDGTPFQLEEYYNIQNEYMSATLSRVFLSLRWNLPCGMFVRAAASWTHAFDLQYIEGNNRWMETISFGYTF